MGTFSANSQRATDGLVAALRTALGTGCHETNNSAIERIDDWNAVAGLAVRHRVVSLTERGLRRSGAMCPGAKSALDPFRKAAIARGLAQLADMHKAVDCLDSHDIPSLVLKGLPLGARLFGLPLERECYDIDLLVAPACARQAADILIRNGWEQRIPGFTPSPIRDRFFEKYVSNRIFSGPAGTLELHHRLTLNPFALPVSFAELAANAATVKVGDWFFQVLNDNDLFVYLCVHGEMHRWSRLKWLCDIATMISDLQEDGFVESLSEARRRGLAAGPVFGTAMRLCSENLHVELPPQAAALATGARTGRRARLTRRLWSRPRGGRGLMGSIRRIDQMRTALSINPSVQCAMRELTRTLAPPYDLGKVDLPDRLFFLYWPLRPLLLLASWLERSKTSRKQRSKSNSGVSRCRVELP